MNRIQEQYRKAVVPALEKRFEYKNPHQVPSLNKIVVSMGVGEATQNKALLDNAVKDLEQITGRKPIVTKARKSISNFKLRQGMPIGCKVTLRGEIMYEFFDRLVSIVIPRIRDFRGISTDSFDGRGNFSMGLKEQTVFPEIEFDKIDNLRGLNINIITTARNDDEARELLKELGMPFKREEE
ncbi:MAG: 50S ribosomal protein L5 [Candidatus Cloacimonadaceae bacterium]|jgi:large subunit ribosomal protein L5|nr:50S ribosomal protein L5 [Candidatus Cloacimonadota bacterium]NLN85013.1 50S ribosomal protein L5 [Candidatus Cloacimonadota bacterium]